MPVSYRLHEHLLDTRTCRADGASTRAFGEVSSSAAVNNYRSGMPQAPVCCVVIKTASDSGWLHVLSELGPIATALAALAALTVGILTVRQRRAADARAEWWKRAEWALDQVLSTPADESKAAVGLAMLNNLADSRLAKTEELMALEAAWSVWLFALPTEAVTEEGSRG